MCGRRAWPWLTALIAALFFSGCGGSSEPPASSGGDAGGAVAEAPAGPSSDQAAESKKPADEKKPAEAKKAASKPAEKAAEEIVAFDAPERAVVARPDSITEWNDEHFVSAKRDRDPRLLDAVAYLGEQFAGDTDVVPLLESLLLTAEDPEPEPQPEPEPEPVKKTARPGSGSYEDMMEGMEGMEEEQGQEEDMAGYEEMMQGMRESMGEGPMEGYEDMYGSGGRRGAGAAEKAVPTLTPGYVSLTGGIVRALGSNGTAAAREVLQRLLAGKVETGDDKVATCAALKALIDNPSLENEAILFRTLTAPETFRSATAEEDKPASEDSAKAADEVPAKEEAITAEMLQATTLPLIEASASTRLRVELAKYLMGSSPAADLGWRLQQFLVETDPYNVAAQILVYGKPEASSKVKNEFELFFTTYSASALGRILSVSSEKPAEVPVAVMLPGAGQTDAVEANRPWTAFGDAPPPSAEQPRGGARGSGRGLSGRGDSSDAGMAEEMDDMYREMQESESVNQPPEGDMEGYEEMMNEAYRGGGRSGERGPAGARPGAATRKAAEPAPADTASAEAFSKRVAVDANLPYELVGSLWNTRLLTEVANRLGGTGTLADSVQLVSLASTVPNDAMRSRLYQTLKAHWQEGPLDLSGAAEFPEQGVKDPGYLAVIKSLERKEAPVKRAPVRRTERGERAERPAPEEAPHPEYEWMTASRDLVQDMCKRFHAAALNESGKFSEVLKSLPFELHPDAQPTAAYHADWLDRVGKKITGVRLDPMQIYYVRIEETAKFGTRLAFYKRELKSPEIRQLEGGAWLDGFREGSEPGRKQSVDVLISRPNFDAERSGREDESLVIEILMVEVNDPAKE